MRGVTYTHTHIYIYMYIYIYISANEPGICYLWYMEVAWAIDCFYRTTWVVGNGCISRNLTVLFDMHKIYGIHWFYENWVLKGQWWVYHKRENERNNHLDLICFKYSTWPVTGKYRKTSSISRTLVGNNIVDNSDVVGASPVGAAPTTSSFST